MVARKEIIILNGGGHKGIVKVSGVTGKDGAAKVSCSLDFRPNGAKLYLIGDNIAQMALNNTNCEAEVAFSAKSEIGCVLRSSSITMFGGSGSKSEMLKRIDTYQHELSLSESDAQGGSKAQKSRAYGSAEGGENVHGDYNGERPSENKSVKTAEAKPANEAAAEVKDAPQREGRAYVDASARADVNPLGEWTKYDGNNFYYAVKPQIDEMFVCYPEEEILVSTVPNSKWVRVDAEDGYYVVGLLYDENEPSFICYGVPQIKSDAPVKAPPELQNMCVWLPVNVSESVSGYWIIYQSAKTGEIIK